jgi:hypothetical protein
MLNVTANATAAADPKSNFEPMIEFSLFVRSLLLLGKP